MDKKALKDRLQYEIENGDAAFLNYVNEAVEIYKSKQPDTFEELPEHVKELLKISLQQAEDGNLLSHEGAMKRIDPRFRFEL
ncbi:hypothetical protein EAX61_13300 [Dokdonia sinensis]|uniref:Uncharacterized protein n=1 Tax=Dokdonia sinensis TaxID=2479847 RepID=A0A3M0G3I9_9FLAO|nr:hypothetical protein [Dokdonia sinensis]RMB56772.1 hypothetical protein EAX61_13300 [Dokdonia sinensis]